MTLTQFLTDWGTVLVVGGLAAMSPGPDFAMTLRNALAYSRRAGLFTALGIAVGLLVHTTYTLVGLGVVIAQSVVAFTVIKYLGAAYLVYVGVQALRARKHDPAVAAVAQARYLSAASAWRRGFLTNILNPKVALLFLALFTQVIQPHTPAPVQAVYGLTIALFALTWFSAVAWLASHEAVKRRYYGVQHWVERVTGLVFIALGVRLALARAQG